MSTSSQKHAPLFSSVNEYVQKLEGNRVIQKVLIANNGMAALKAIRSIRKWAYEMFGNDRAIQFVAMATPDDIGANAEYIRMADECVQVPAGPNVNNYANVDLIVDLAEQTGVDAVWAGWGHASENPRLPDKLSHTPKKIVFMGPPAGPMQALGDKISSSIVAQSADVPCLGWSGDGLTVSNIADGIPDDVYARACTPNVEEALTAAKRVGYPLMIKASEGGGGKGIRKVHNDEELVSGFRQVQGEVPGSPIFLMKLASISRHLEVQLLADSHGTAISLFSRDCSVQRRHQKIIEEGPVVAAPQEVLDEMERAAVRLAEAVSYIGVGTVEYLYTEGKHFFLELNPRLQVEHPVTEGITNVNLPAAQLHVAMGIPLHRIPDIRRYYGEESFGTTKIDFKNRRPLPPRGHVIATRITAENPEDGFSPSSGSIHELTFRNAPNVWGYFSVGPQGGVHKYADSQFGHLFAYGSTREEARRLVLLALRELSIRGEIRTTVEYLQTLLELPDFIDNNITTSWLDALIAQKLTPTKPDPLLVVTCGAVSQLHSAWESNRRKCIGMLERGQNLSTDLLKVYYPLEIIYENTKYSIQGVVAGPESYVLAMNGTATYCEVKPLKDGGILVLLGQKSHVVYCKDEAIGTRVVVDGRTCFFTKEFDPSKIRANMPGKLVRFLVEDGAHIGAKQAFAEIEVMKMYLPLVAAFSGKIRFRALEGSALETGHVIAEMELDDPSQVKKAVKYEGSFGGATSGLHHISLEAKKPHIVVRTAAKVLSSILEGYDPVFTAEKKITECVRAIVIARTAEVAICELQDLLSVYSSKLPKGLSEAAHKAIDALQLKTPSQSSDNLSAAPEHPTEETFHSTLVSMRDLFHGYAAVGGAADAPVLAPFLELFNKFLGDIDSSVTFAEQQLVYKASVLSGILAEYLRAEQLFDTVKSRDDVVAGLRDKNKDDLGVVFSMALSHKFLKSKNKAALAILHAIEMSGLLPFCLPTINALASLNSRLYADVALKAKHLLMISRMPSFELKQQQLERILDLAAAEADPKKRREILSSVIEFSIYGFDVLLSFFSGAKDPKVVCTAIEAYVYKTYTALAVENLAIEQLADGVWSASWHFNVPAGSGQQTPLKKHEGIIGAHSFDNLLAMKSAQGDEDTSNGYAKLLIFESFEQCQFVLKDILSNHYTPDGDPTGVLNVLTVMVRWARLEAMTDENMIRTASELIAHCKTCIADNEISRVTFAPYTPTHPPRYYSFRQRLGFNEDPIYRHIEPSLAFQLELHKLANYNIQLVPMANRQIHVYFAEEKKGARQRAAVASGAPATESSLKDRRFFVRVLALQGDIFNANNSYEFQIAEAENVFVEALNALEMALDDTRYDRTDGNHIFLNFLPEIVVEPAKVQDIIARFAYRHESRLLKLRINQVEVRLNVKTSLEAETMPLRFIAFNPTFYRLCVELYVEVKNPTGKTTLQHIFSSSGSAPGGKQGSATQGSLSAHDVTIPYPLSDALQQRRYLARTFDTLFVHDFVSLFQFALDSIWSAYRKERKVPRSKVPEEYLKVVELVLAPGKDRNVGPYVDLTDENCGLIETNRGIGENDIGMVAWKFTLFTPEFPAGREIIVIANDITIQSGSFGTREDLLFLRASALARKKGIPRIYIAANSGARIGLANEVKEAFRVAWLNEDDHSKGFKYLYLTPADHERLRASVVCTPIVETVRVKNADGSVKEVEETRYKITDVIGEQDGLGVENLQGSGMIAGETSRAYDEIFTLTYVASRSVGIGAYLVRLGQRTIQHRRHPIILTGAPALNKVLGKEVYSSNNQLGGIQIMYNNGVSHMVVNDDLRAVQSILSWLSFVPAVRDGALPILPPLDPIDRPVEFCPVKDQVYDPRHLLAGFFPNAPPPITSPSAPVAPLSSTSPPSSQETSPSIATPAQSASASPDEWISGFFDKSSFVETLGGWAKNVVCGRARLGGIPVGAICVETRTVENVVPADPADPSSHEKVLPKAGGVWYPDSAFKTAQAIRDFNAGEQLPLFIFANWRGFSGGMRDMFEEVLKFGSYIVDALRSYRQPIFVYMPPQSELRGGAWVVVDPSINPQRMEMYADKETRGGVLEPAGTIEIKFRERDIQAAMARMDEDYKTLKEALASKTATQAEKDALMQRIKAREQLNMPAYKNVAVTFADLHDTPGRMKAKNVISAVVEWRSSRSFFYWRLKRRLEEDAIKAKITTADPALSFEKATALLQKWVAESDAPSAAQAWSDDRTFVQWAQTSQDHIAYNLESVREEYVKTQIAALFKDSPDAAAKAAQLFLVAHHAK